MENDIAIKVESANKAFRLPHESSGSVKNLVINFSRRKKGYEELEALKDVSFEVKRGEFFGIVGRNGSGKSTLLKMLAGIYVPTTGHIQVNGKLTPFIELGVGFNPELTGRENVFLNGALLGFNRKEMAAMYDDIVAFAELERFMDQKLKNYSSGMQVRLAFSIAIKAQSDILLFDEVLAVGDSEFQKKCYDYFRQVKDEGNKTIILVTHDMAAVQRFCTRALVIDDGCIIHEGTPSEASVLYQNINFPEQSSSKDKEQKVQLAILTESKDNEKSPKIFESGEDLRIRVTWAKSLKGVKNVGVALLSNNGSYIFGANTIDDEVILPPSKNTIDYHVNLNVGEGIYSFKAAVFGDTSEDTIFFNERGITIQVKNQGKWGGLTKLKHTWALEA